MLRALPTSIHVQGKINQ